MEAPRNDMPTAGADGVIRKIGAAFALAGVGFMAYLTKLHYSSGDSSLCDLSASLNCSVVNQSIYSEILIFPVSGLGLLYFAAMAWAFLAKDVAHRYPLIIGATTFSLVFGGYLTGIEYFVLGSFCLFCELSKATMLAILAAAVIGAKKAGKKIEARHVVGGLVVGVIFAAGAYFIQREPIGVPDYTAQAQCLTDNGVHMYGAYWCTHCATQKRLFGDAFERISYIECDPRGEEAQTERCIARGIRSTPTWIRETTEGEVLDSLEGTQDVMALAERFGCADTEIVPEPAAEANGTAPEGSETP